jgi:hypothetical protein
MKKFFEEAEVELISVEADIITTSGDEEEEIVSSSKNELPKDKLVLS